MLCSALSFTAAAAAAAAAVRTTHSAVKMSAGDVVCTGWLIKSPPEKKLKRFAWRKRWFVLRRGRMSGNPDVLEYYQSKNSKKPIRIIDLKECEVEMLNGQLRIKRDFHGKHLFVVKTSSRVFYLVAKTEEEMNGWISSISQICHFGSLEDAESSEEGFPHTPTSPQPSPDNSGRASVSSQLDSSHPLDYLFLSQCETGSMSTSRHESFSNSEISLEQKSSEDTVKDIVPSPLYTNSSSSISHASPSPSLFLHRRLSNPPFSAPCTSMALPSSSSSPLSHCATSVFQFDKPFSSASLEERDDRHTPPPLPPKPTHPSEQQSDGGAHRLRPMNAQHFSSHMAFYPQKTSLSSLDQFRTGDADVRLMSNRRPSQNLPSLNNIRVQNYQDESYVPMASPSPYVITAAECDGYIPMSLRMFSFLNTDGSVESSTALNQLMCQPGDFVPPPIHRHLKPRLRRVRPPPLDLSGLSTITECPTHLHLSRAMTDSCFSVNVSPPESRPEKRENSRNEDSNGTAMESGKQFGLTFDGAVQTWARRSNLDYLSLDFNSASPSPVQKKPFLSDEHRVDYVQVDEKKTQALQNTKMEWTDVRQSKT